MWEVKTVCECGEENVVKVAMDFSQALAVPVNWTGFGNGYVIQGVYCPNCSKQLREIGAVMRQKGD